MLRVRHCFRFSVVACFLFIIFLYIIQHEQQLNSISQEKSDGLSSNSISQEKLSKKLSPKLIPSPSTPNVQSDHSSTDLVAVLIFACKRVTVERTLTALLKSRHKDRFPVIVSQDCNDEETARVIDRYENEALHLKFPGKAVTQPPPNQAHFASYYRIAAHYKWALHQVFEVLLYENVILVEDDLEPADDFFEYFSATLPILKADETIMCISTWNDNGKRERVSDLQAIYRSDFFPGLGWLMPRRLWRDLEAKWPDRFWDDWLRQPENRKNRICLYPEISRNRNNGKVGASNGVYFDEHIATVLLADRFVNFTQLDLSYLLKDQYDGMFLDRVYRQSVAISLSQLDDSVKDHEMLRIEYHSRQEFEHFAKELKLMDDVRADVPRCSYLGVVTLKHLGRLVYLAPPENTWKGTLIGFKA